MCKLLIVLLFCFAKDLIEGQNKMVPWNLLDVILGDNYNKICMYVYIYLYNSLITVQVAQWSKAITETYELTEECLEINYYGAKRTSEALIPLLQLSDSPRIVNVSSSIAKLEVWKLSSIPLETNYIIKAHKSSYLNYAWI